MISYYRQINADVAERECRIDDTPENIPEMIEKFIEPLDWLEREGVKHEEILVDYTGGRKWMSAVAISMCQHFGLRSAYVHADFSPQINKPDKETVHLIETTSVVQHVHLSDLREADNSFNRGKFGDALCEYSALMDKIADAGRREEILVKKISARPS